MSGTTRVDGEITAAEITHETNDIIDGWHRVVRSVHYWAVRVERAHPSYRPDRSTKEWHANTFDEAVAILARVTKAAS